MFFRNVRCRQEANDVEIIYFFRLVKKDCRYQLRVDEETHRHTENKSNAPCPSAGALAVQQRDRRSGSRWQRRVVELID
jgi:hypothetical protein